MRYDDEQQPVETSLPPAQDASAGEEEPGTAQESALSMDQALEQGFRTLEKGEIIEATVVQVEKEGVLVDVGTKTEGVIPLEELSDQRLSSAEGVVSVGDKINVMVLKPEEEEGNPVLSKKRADFEMLWERIEQAYQTGAILHAMVIERVRGGLVVDLGVRGFIPGSHVGLHGNLRNLDRFVGQSLPIKVMDVDRERRKVVASNKLAEEELQAERLKERRQRQMEIFSRLSVGQIVEGEVKRFASYGAFVDIGGYEGLLHISEMSWGRVEDPRDVLKVGDRIQVMILKLDPEKGKVSLGLRQVLPDPWAQIASTYHVGETVKGTISRLVRNGTFLRLLEGVEAFIPLSELSSRRLKQPEEVVSTGQEVEALIIEMNPEQRRMILSLRAMEEQGSRKEARRASSRTGSSSGFTIGERLQDQLQNILLPGEIPEENIQETAGKETENGESVSNRA